ncbi:DUF6343 family protein [Kineococcus sp. SYSU DK002]|uniref:DUF6343 family protein n=1 Tax=Kineococcus sp. SYSU DK002 TaxID=3383123 RepID=UPI003D7DA119
MSRRHPRPTPDRATGTAEPRLRVDPGQPRGRTGEEARTARSPLRLRLVLALFGLVVCTALAVAWFTVDDPPGGSRAPGWVLAVLAGLAVVDLVVVSRRLRRRRR